MTVPSVALLLVSAAFLIASKHDSTNKVLYVATGPITVVYTRWGKSTCPSGPGTQLVYAGRAGGSNNGQVGVEPTFSACPLIQSTPYRTTAMGSRIIHMCIE